MRTVTKSSRLAAFFAIGTMLGIILTSSVQADIIGTVTFGTDWDSLSPESGDAGASAVFTKTQDGIDFVVTAVAGGGPLQVAGDRLAIRGGAGGNWYIDPGESITFSLSVVPSVTFLDLSLDAADLQGRWLDGPEGFFTDQDATPVVNFSPEVQNSYRSWNYTGDGVDYALPGLTTLSAANISTWRLTVGGADLDAGESGEFQVKQLSFDYTIPEPSALALLGLSSIALFVRRR